MQSYPCGKHGLQNLEMESDTFSCAMKPTLPWKQKLQKGSILIMS